MRKFQIYRLVILAIVLLTLMSKFDIGALKAFDSSYQVRNVFIDLGANKGDSVLNFLGLQDVAQGGKLSKLFKKDSIASKDWIIYAFEANPYFNDILNSLSKEIEQKYPHVSFKLYKETAAWTKNGFIDFYVDTVNNNTDFWGSSLNKQHPDSKRSGGKKVQVACKDIAEIINQYNERDLIVVKMDIEGAEYDLLLDFMQKDVLRLIDHIAIEFHPFVSPFKGTEDVLQAIIRLYGANFLNWN
jgi:FkbM family methyltransferase